MRETQRRHKAARRLFFLTAISRLDTGFTMAEVEEACRTERISGHDYGLANYQYPQTFGALIKELVADGVVYVTKDSCNLQRNLYWWTDEDGGRTEEDDIVDEWAGVLPVRPTKRQPASKEILDKESKPCFNGGMDTATATAPTTTRPATPRPATDRQISYLTSLDSDMRTEFPDQVLDDDGCSEVWYSIRAHGTGATLLSVERASELIDWCITNLRQMRNAKVLRSLDADVAKTKLEITDGFWYIATDPVQIIKIQRAVHGSGNLYGKLLTPPPTPEGKWHFEFTSGLLRHMVDANTRGIEVAKLTPERAKEFGHLYGICCVCGATLTDEKSIAAGIGPVCGRRI